MGDLERRAGRLEEQAELGRQAERYETERVFREALSRLSTSELRAMKESMDSTDQEGWTKVDEPLMRQQRLAGKL